MQALDLTAGDPLHSEAPHINDVARLIHLMCEPKLMTMIHEATAPNVAAAAKRAAWQDLSYFYNNHSLGPDPFLPLNPTCSKHRDQTGVEVRNVPESPVEIQYASAEEIQVSFDYVHQINPSDPERLTLAHRRTGRWLSDIWRKLEPELVDLYRVFYREGLLTEPPGSDYPRLAPREVHRWVNLCKSRTGNVLDINWYAYIVLWRTDFRRFVSTQLTA
jgi:hypothetical protein